MANEEFAYVLDYLAKGKSSDVRENPIAQVIGTTHFTLLEVVPKQELKSLQKVYIGKDKREEISLIKQRIQHKELTSNAVAELENSVRKIVEDNQEKFLNFYNNSSSISLRMHQTELLPGFGKKHVLNFLDEREKQEFESFEDINKRVSGLPDSKKAIIRRILLELQGDNEVKYYLFARRPPEEDNEKRRFSSRNFRRPHSDR